MKPYYEDESITLYAGDCLDVLAELPGQSVDAVVTDPPYGLRFMGKSWDGADIESATATRRRQAAMPDDGRSGPNGGYRSASTEAGRYDLSANAAFGHWCEAWAVECLRILNPGGHLLAFGGSRTWHRLTCAVEDAGFEIRDSIAWLYGSGFPKSKNLDGEWSGWGTALKPAFEPIVVARKPLAGTVSGNVQTHGTGAFNIDACRIHTAGSQGKAYTVKRLKPGATLEKTGGSWRPDDGVEYQGQTKDGRWPPNVILDESQASALDAQSGEIPGGNRPAKRSGIGYGSSAKGTDDGISVKLDAGGASRFFYTAKADQAERLTHNGIAHPTVKPLNLMRWLVRLVTPPGGLILEPFAGSGTTVEAAILEGFRCISIEREADYLPLITQRINRRRDPIKYLTAAGDDLGLFGDGETA